MNFVHYSSLLKQLKEMARLKNWCTIEGLFSNQTRKLFSNEQSNICTTRKANTQGAGRWPWTGIFEFRNGFSRTTAVIFLQVDRYQAISVHFEFEIEPHSILESILISLVRSFRHSAFFFALALFPLPPNFPFIDNSKSSFIKLYNRFLILFFVCSYLRDPGEQVNEPDQIYSST